MGSSINNTETMSETMKKKFLCFTDYFKMLVFLFYGLLTRNIKIYRFYFHVENKVSILRDLFPL